MKNSILFSLLLSTVASHAFANESAPGEGGKNHPCKNIVAACESAKGADGQPLFPKGGHKKGGKGLWVDCVQKIKAGETVAGVDVKAEDVTACKEKKEKRAERKAEREAEAGKPAPAASAVPAKN